MKNGCSILHMWRYRSLQHWAEVNYHSRSNIKFSPISTNTSPNLIEVTWKMRHGLQSIPKLKAKHATKYLQIQHLFFSIKCLFFTIGWAKVNFSDRVCQDYIDASYQHFSKQIIMIYLLCSKESKCE